MRHLALLAITFLLAGVVATAVAKEPRAPAAPQQIISYHDSGRWSADITSVVGRAKQYVKRTLAHHRPRRPAVVLDIDDTSLSLYACMKPQGFTRISIATCVVRENLPAIRQTRAFFRYVRRSHVAVFFVTG